MVKTVYHITCGNGHKFEANKNDTRCHICDEKISWKWQIETEIKSDLTADDLLHRICRWLEKRDPNYTCGELQEHDADFIGQKIILADWNNMFNYENLGKKEHNWKQVNRLADFIEKKCNALTGFNDEYTSCYGCNKIISTSPGYYGDQKNFVFTEYEILCRECVLTDPESIIDAFKNDPRKALPNWFYPEIEKAGFVCYSPDEYCQKFETGLHIGQDDDPKAIAKNIENELLGYDYLFKINDIGQFDINWSIFIRKNEEE